MGSFHIWIKFGIVPFVIVTTTNQVQVPCTRRDFNFFDNSAPPSESWPNLTHGSIPSVSCSEGNTLQGSHLLSWYPQKVHRMVPIDLRYCADMRSQETWLQSETCPLKANLVLLFFMARLFNELSFFGCLDVAAFWIEKVCWKNKPNQANHKSIQHTGGQILPCSKKNSVSTVPPDSFDRKPWNFNPWCSLPFGHWSDVVRMRSKRPCPWSIHFKVRVHQMVKFLRCSCKRFDSITLITNPHRLVVAFDELMGQATFLPVPTSAFKTTAPSTTHQVSSSASLWPKHRVPKLVSVREHARK